MKAIEFSLSKQAIYSGQSSSQLDTRKMTVQWTEFRSLSDWKRVGSVLGICAIGGALAILLSIVLSMFPRLNILIFPDLFWFVVPIGWLSWKYFDTSRAPEESLKSAVLRGEKAVLI